MERSIGRYRVVGVLGAGAMGEVLRARDDRLGRDVAIKRMKPLIGAAPPAFTARFEAEARALAALTHPGVVQVFDLGVDDDQPYLVMELVDGPSLRAVLEERGALPVAEVRAAGIQLARALEAAHARGVLHRDIKPANVLVAPGGGWKLADFGLAHLPDSTVTLTGQFLGTPSYAAPEALTVGQFSPASDVFGLAATLYEAATGERPRGDASLTQLLTRSSEPVLGPDAPPPPPELAAALNAGLAIDPAARPSAAAFAELLATAGSFESAELAAASSSPSVDLGPDVAPPRRVSAVSAVALPAAPPAPRRWHGVVAIAALIAVPLLLVAIDRTNDRRPAHPPAHPPAAPPTPPAADQPAPPIQFAAPTDLDGRSAHEWSKIADRVHDGHFRDALHKLIEFEQRFGAGEETSALRAWLEQQVAAGYD